MLVVADASPLNVLVRIRSVDILPALFSHVIIPRAVERELSHPSTPTEVKEWLASTPAWLEVRVPNSEDTSLPVGPGEREAISLAREIGADLLLVDDRKARRAALRQGLRIAGTLGLLEEAAARDLLDLREALERLRMTEFSISNMLLREALDRDKRRRGGAEPQQAAEPDEPGRP